MKKKEDIRRFTDEELKERRKLEKSSSDFKAAAAMSDADLERNIDEDEGERDLVPDWTKAKLIEPCRRKSVHLRIEEETLAFFKKRGKGHLSMMQSVLKTYADAHRNSPNHKKG